MESGALWEVVRKIQDCIHAMVDWWSMLVVFDSKKLQWKGLPLSEFAYSQKKTQTLINN